MTQIIDDSAIDLACSVLMALSVKGAASETESTAYYLAYLHLREMQRKRLAGMMPLIEEEGRSSHSCDGKLTQEFDTNERLWYSL